MINESARQLAQEFSATDWFGHVGTAKHLEVAALADGWAEAMESRCHVDWENLLLREQDNLFHALGCPNSWNALVQELNVLIAQVIAKQSRQLAALGFGKPLQDEIEWDLLHALIEAHYDPVPVPGFYTRIGQWYLHGHFPCGWDGQYPVGRFIVY